MYEFKSEVIHYCNNFQEGKCKFGEKCKYEHEINPNSMKEDIFINKNKNNIYNKNNKNEAPFRKNVNTNNCKGSNNNYNHSQQRSKINDGQPLKYSNQNFIPLRNFNNTGDSANQYTNNNNSNWLFSKNSVSANINPRMYVLKQGKDIIKHIDMDDFDQNPDVFKWKFLNHHNENFMFDLPTSVPKKVTY